MTLDGSQYIKLEQRLVLLAWLNGRFGYAHNRDLLADVKEAAEGFDASGRSYVYHRLEARGDRVKIPLPDLARYDDHIREHLRAMNARRPEPITLRYFQHLAVLFTEIFLDWYFHRRGEMLRSLNRFVEDRNASKTAADPKDAKFSESDLKKLAFWMATGSGKTLIMHINYRQFLHYNDLPLDNILLITPNEGLSEQHMEEMTASDIPCRRFDLNESGLMTAGKDAVRVIEITKLVEEKRGGGVSVPVEAFEGNNLIFVDEGHKGSGGEAWRSFRDALGATGFTFEYSATFGQALTAARNDQLTAEYGKAIVFDYSYRYFHGDGYGKDFRILNLKEEAAEEKTETLLMGNLLSFYEQQRVFEEQAGALRPYNLEKPLWVFVGSTVNAVYSEEKQKRSDVLTVARFLHHVLENNRSWAVGTIEKLIEGKTGLVTPDGRDVFEDKFKYLRRSGLCPKKLYQDILAKVLHAPAGGGLHLCDIRGSDGEIGLKAGGAEDHFGLIYIGDTSSFKKLVEEDDAGITLEEDAVTGSLFDTIGDPGTTIDVLIGAKKFMEGWNSWRVSNMGLLNIGRKEGSEIIQLFGRGVRLRGKGFSLKRSAALDGRHPDHVGLLETLNIFAVRANYMSQFRDYLEREGVEVNHKAVVDIPIKASEVLCGQRLLIPTLPDDKDYKSDVSFILEDDPAIFIRMDLSTRIDLLESHEQELAHVGASGGKSITIPKDMLNLLDWENIYLDLLAYKEQKELSNVVILPGKAKELMRSGSFKYEFIADDTLVHPAAFANLTELSEAVSSLLKQYLETFYQARHDRWLSDNMVYETLRENHTNFSDYTLSFGSDAFDLIAFIEKSIESGEIYRKELGSGFKTVYFDRHLFQPLIWESENMKSTPPGLEESEAQFVKDLRDYYQKEKDGLLRGKDVFLLRNLSRGRGVGFFQSRGFYPDFILWIITKDRQKIIFIEPHGMLHIEAPRHEDRTKLHTYLHDLTDRMNKRGGRDDIVLDSFVVSHTPFDVLQRRYANGDYDREKFAMDHILFEERNQVYDYLKIIFENA